MDLDIQFSSLLNSNSLPLSHKDDKIVVKL